MKIWRFSLGEVITPKVVNLTMPKGADVLHIESQRNMPCLWALVDPGAEKEQRSFYLAATGEEPPKGQYLGTVLQYDDAYVWHVFEVEDA